MRRRKDPFEKPWVILAAVVGIIAVVIIALLFFTGDGASSPSTPEQPAPGTVTTSGQQSSVVGVAPSVVKTQAPVTVPKDGVSVRVSYIGGFAGSYGMEGNMTTVRNSGDRVFVVEDPNGTVSASFHKEDASTRHELVVEIYKDGISQQVASNSSSYGEASVTYTV